MANNLEFPFKSITNFGSTYSSSAGNSYEIGFSIAGGDELDVRILRPTGISILALNSAYRVDVSGGRSNDGLFRTATLVILPGLTVGSTDRLLFRRKTAANSGLTIEDGQNHARAVQNNIDRLYRVIQELDVRLAGTVRMMKLMTAQDGSSSLVPATPDVLVATSGTETLLGFDTNGNIVGVTVSHDTVEGAQAALASLTTRITAVEQDGWVTNPRICLLYTSPSPRD